MARACSPDALDGRSLKGVRQSISEPGHCCTIYTGNPISMPGGMLAFFSMASMAGNGVGVFSGDYCSIVTSLVNVLVLINFFRTPLARLLIRSLC